MSHVALPLLTLLAAAAAGIPAALDSLVAADRAFARMSVENGMRDAFLAFLADDAVIFTPLPVNGKKTWEARAPSRATLAWEPAYAEISAAWDFGFTTGPWELRPPNDARDHTVIHGHFISVWERRAGGPWKVILDIGYSHEKPERGVGSGDLTLGPAPSGREPWPGRRRVPEKELAAVELRFARAARSLGFAAAFSEWATPDVRLDREGQQPRLGLAAALAALEGDTASATWTQQATRAARSADLGYTYGIRERHVSGDAAPDSSVYAHIWRRGADGRWRVALAVENPLRPR